MPCAAQLLQSAVTRLQSAGSDEPQANAEWLLACALNVSRTWVLANASREISPEDEAVFNRMLTRKEAGEPLSHIVGFQPFCGLDIRVTPDVLTPRPETEELAELAAAAFDRRGRYEFLDMCTGSGCIALALANKFPQARVLAADVSEAALRVAQENARIHRLTERIQFLQSDLWENVMGTFDLIISNPPYIPTADLEGLTCEVKHEPRLALDGGEDGYNITRPLCQAAAGYLKPGGLLALELCKGQAWPLARGLEEIGWKAEVKKDIFNIERFVLARKI
ncbi:peptide chain release factor N(5)-glutamine methyltransferase [Candidatus Avelusimicrobium alvi]|uniref:peptide chain release factor N(5)-glutamine methyltransferase n=1 Tax=Candidatus Avelusimicrobium alvi TaxID=3416221 RepID=UPI003D0E4CC9